MLAEPLNRLTTSRSPLSALSCNSSRKFILVEIRLIRFLAIGGANTGFNYALYAFLPSHRIQICVCQFPGLGSWELWPASKLRAHLYSIAPKIGEFLDSLHAGGAIYLANIAAITTLVRWGLSAYVSESNGITFHSRIFLFFLQKCIGFRRPWVSNNDQQNTSRLDGQNTTAKR